MSDVLTMNGNGTVEASEEQSAAAVAPDLSLVTISFKAGSPVHIEIDPDKLMWDDMQMIQRVTSGKATEEEAGEMFIELLTKLTGQDARQLPLRVINGIVAQLHLIAGGGEEAKNSD